MGDFDRIRNRWFYSLEFLILVYSLYSMEDFKDLIDILVNM